METELEELVLAGNYEDALSRIKSPGGPELLDRACLGLLNLLGSQLDGSDPETFSQAAGLLTLVTDSCPPREVILGLLNLLGQTRSTPTLLLLLPLVTRTLRRLPKHQDDLVSALRLVAKFMSSQFEPSDVEQTGDMAEVTAAVLAVAREFPEEKMPVSSLLLVLFRLLEVQRDDNTLLSRQVVEEVNRLRPDVVWEVSQGGLGPKAECVGLLAARELVDGWAPALAPAVRTHDALWDALAPHAAALMREPGRDRLLDTGTLLTQHILRPLLNHPPWPLPKVEETKALVLGLVTAMVTSSRSETRSRAVSVFRCLLTRFEPMGSLGCLRFLSASLPKLKFLLPVHRSGVRGQMADYAKSQLTSIRPVFKEVVSVCMEECDLGGDVLEQSDHILSILSLLFLALSREEEREVGAAASKFAVGLEKQLDEQQKLNKMFSKDPNAEEAVIAMAETKFLTLRCQLDLLKGVLPNRRKP